MAGHRMAPAVELRDLALGKTCQISADGAGLVDGQPRQAGREQQGVLGGRAPG